MRKFSDTTENITQLLQRLYIDTIGREQTSIGVEIELPLVRAAGGPVERAFIERFTAQIQRLGFAETKRTLDRQICELENAEGDLCSFETSWNTLELSMSRDVSLLALVKRFYPLLMCLQTFCLSNGYFLCGQGINPNCATLDPAPLNTPILLAKSQYLEQFTTHHDGEIFHAIIASVQTHLDATDTAHYLALFNMLRKVYALEGLFFANSPPPDASFLRGRPSLENIDADTLCFRDELWLRCGAPNLQTTPGDFTSADELLQYLEGLQLFILRDEGNFRPTSPIPLAKYFGQRACAEEELDCFRSLEPVVPTKNGSLEIRSTCTQPLNALFEPSAFYLGLSGNVPRAGRQVDAIFNRFFFETPPSEARSLLMKASNSALRSQVKKSMTALLNTAVGGLRYRGLGEEKLLAPLKKRMEKDNYAPPALSAEKEAMDQAKQQMGSIEREYLL